MKNMRKIFALLIAVVMLLAIAVPVLAASVDSGKGGSASITITLPTEETAPTGTTTYKIYKVFDATSDGSTSAISYTSRQGETMPSGFVLDSAGNVHHGTKATDGTITENTATALTQEEITAIAGYVRDADLVYTANVAAGETTVTVTGLEYGYYYITTTTGTVVTVDSTNPSANVNDKNVIPPVVKSAGTAYDEDSLQAIAAVGTSQPFTAVITKTHGATNLVFTDTMVNMIYNGDVAITVSAGTAPTAAQAVVATTETGFKVTFDNDYIAGLADGTTITLNYSATITSDALSRNPATNKATISSGENNSNTYESEEVDVYNAKFTVSKKDGNGAALAGAGFVIANSAGKYYKLNAATAAVEDDPTTDEDESAPATPATISWVDDIEEATEYTSGADGAVPAFTGLGNGTYTLIEKTVPAGYNKAADQTFTVSDSNYTAANLEQTAEVTNNSGSELPSTGGIGTTIFYIVGSVLVVGAVVFFIAKRRVRAH